MLLKGWLWHLLPLLLSVVSSQDATGICNKALGVSSGDIEDVSITSLTADESTPSAGRLNKEDGAWCFSNDTISSHSAALIIDLNYKRFVSGFGSQGPPESVHPKAYNHLIGFSAASSLDKNSWEEFNGGNLFFDVDKNDTSDVVNYHVSNTVELTQYIKINVTMQISGSTTICLRFEIYGCDTTVLPSTSVQAVTTPKGKIEVNWKKPSVETTLEPDVITFGVLTPDGYAVLYRPQESQSFATAATGDRMISLEDVRLGATYVIQLQCLYKDTVVSCGSTEVEAYPPCPEGFTGGNEYHCFLYLSPVSSFPEARTTCLNSKFSQQLGTLGYLVDEEERKFLVSRIFPKGISELWLVGEMCQDNEDCCKILKIQGEDTIEDAECSDEVLTAALCLRNHKGEGARLRVSSVEAADDGSSASFTWRYEGIGWKTDELQVKTWTSDKEDAPSTFTFSTLSNTFELNTNINVMYSLLLRPAPNIRTEEFVYKFIIIDFQDDSAKHGAVLIPVPMSIYIIWSGSIRVTWEEAKAVSKSETVRLSEKYSITYQMTEPESTLTEVEIESKTEFVLTPIEMQAAYLFKMSCFFAGSFHPCGEISIKTDPPDLVLYKPSNVYVVYEVIDKLKIWAEAEDDCQQRAGHLTSLLDDSEAKALLKMLPNKDSKIWTGAKLGKKSTGYWTDGQKITDLPMSKNSGVTSSSESCCRAINENGKLRLAGGNCEDRYPYICKYTVEEIISIPSGLTADEYEWNSFKVSWSKPSERWMPTFYNARACLTVSKINCVVKNRIQDEWVLTFDNLLEFQSYDVEVEAMLRPVSVKSVSEMSVMTYPKSPVKVSISSKGEGYVNVPILIAKGFPSATVTLTVLQLDMKLDTISGGVKDLAISGLVPEETYKLLVKYNEGEWAHEMDFVADPTCIGMDILIDTECYTLVEDSSNFDDAKKKCSEASDNKKDTTLWIPQSEEQLKDVVMNFGPYLNSWVQKPEDGSLSRIDSSCSKGDGSCCFYDITSSSISCSSCCDQMLPLICSYKVKATYLGQVTNLLPEFVGNTTIQVEWGPPNDVSWTIRRFEVEWVDVEKSTSEGKDVVVGATNKKIEGLEYGTEYEIRVTPLGASSARGDKERILITTLDPRTPITVTVDSDGTAKVYSPLLIEKGRGKDQVNVKLHKLDESEENKKFLSTYSGQVEEVLITGLEVGQKYSVEMSPKSQDKMFSYSADFLAYPSCKEGQIQEGLICVWAPSTTKTWKEAYQVCRGENGELLDYKTQEVLTQPVKALLTSHIQSHFWLDMGSEGTAALRDASSSDCPSGSESDVMCCSYEVSDEGNLDHLKCTCCDEPRPFACKKIAKISLGDIGEVLVDDVNTDSFTVSWTMASESKWQKPSFLITWSEVSSRKKREVDKQLVIKQSPATVTDVKSGTKYKVAVAPYTDATKSSGDPKEVMVTTKDDSKVAVAGWFGDSCILTIFKISCSIAVIIGSLLAVSFFIIAKMFYLDCLAQIFAELGTLGAYICILISSVQSYSDDVACKQAHPTLCVAVSVLIQFFFQVVFLFLFLESLFICSVLKDFLPQCCTFRSVLAMSISGFGIPAAMMILLAAVTSDGFSDGDENCWLDLRGNAMLPSVIPVIVFGIICCLLLMSVFDSDGPKEGLSGHQMIRGREYVRTRWGCFLTLVITSICYATGMIGANNKDYTLNYIFVGFSYALGILLPFFRVWFDNEIRLYISRGLFNRFKDDFGTIRVSPAPDERYEPHPLLNMKEFKSRKHKQLQFEGMKSKQAINLNTETVWHQ